MPTIQDQLNELKATLEAICLGIEALKARLDGACTGQEDCDCPDCETNRAGFNAWASAFDQRWANRDHECGPLCPDHADPRDTNVIKRDTHWEWRR